jgi:hypothetical protein
MDLGKNRQIGRFGNNVRGILYFLGELLLWWVKCSSYLSPIFIKIPKKSSIQWETVEIWRRNKWAINKHAAERGQFSPCFGGRRTKKCHKFCENPVQHNWDSLVQRLSSRCPGNIRLLFVLFKINFVFFGGKMHGKNDNKFSDSSKKTYRQRPIAKVISEGNYKM